MNAKTPRRQEGRQEGSWLRFAPARGGNELWIWDILGLFGTSVGFVLRRRAVVCQNGTWLCFAEFESGCAVARGGASRRCGARAFFCCGLSGYRGAHVGPPMDRAVVRVWDHFCASLAENVGFWSGIGGNIFIF